MKLNLFFLGAIASAVFVAIGLFAADSVTTTPPVYVPDLSHANDPLPDGVLAWDNLMETTNVGADETEAHFVFNFTNVAKTIDITLVTNFSTATNITAITTVTNITAVTNSITPASVAILSAKGSCSCTTTELPSVPWVIPPGGTGQIGATVDLRGKNGTLFKTVNVSTDKGSKALYLRITILPPVIRNLSDAERARQMAVAKVDRQAVFKNDCAGCHSKPAEGKYGKALYDAVCGVCHEAERRATMVPDLHNLKTPTSDQFWQTWIAHGKPGSLMPAFSTADGGPLTDMQIASIAAYLDYTVPSHIPSAGQ
jgi:mono/diheme cytochrome c family protein